MKTSLSISKESKKIAWTEKHGKPFNEIKNKILQKTKMSYGNSLMNSIEPYF